MVNLAAAFEKEEISAFRFNFAGNRESEGSFRYGNYRGEADDLRAVVEHFHEEKRSIAAIVGHSKGGNAVLLYASRYNDVQTIINISGRFNLERGIEGRFGRDFRQKIKQDGFIDVRNRRANSKSGLPPSGVERWTHMLICRPIWTTKWELMQLLLLLYSKGGILAWKIMLLSKLLVQQTCNPFLKLLARSWIFNQENSSMSRKFIIISMVCCRWKGKMFIDWVIAGIQFKLVMLFGWLHLCLSGMLHWARLVHATYCIKM